MSRFNIRKFNAYLSRYETALAPQENDKVHLIRREMEKAANDLIKHLSKYTMFDGASLIKSGSTYEGFKIGEPDEFDFMIELPAMNSSVVKFSRHPVVNEELLYTVCFLTKDIVKDISTTKFWETLRDIIRDCLESCLGKEWTVKNIEVVRERHLAFKNGEYKNERVTFKVPKEQVDAEWTKEAHAAVTLDLNRRLSSSESLDVSVDFCLAVPMLINKENYCDVRFPGDVNNATGFMRCHMLLMTDFPCRLSFSAQEMRMALKYPYPQGQNRCMRLLKYLRDNEMHLQDDEKFPSYWIKTTLYYMYQK